MSLTKESNMPSGFQMKFSFKVYTLFYSWYFSAQISSVFFWTRNMYTFVYLVTWTYTLYNADVKNN